MLKGTTELLQKDTIIPINDKDHEKYKQYRNSLKRVLRLAKEQYYKDKCIEYKRNTSKLWKMVNTIISKQNDKLIMIEYLKVGNVETYNPKEITKQFGKYFSTVGENYAQQIPEPKNPNSGIYKKFP